MRWKKALTLTLSRSTGRRNFLVSRDARQAHWRNPDMNSPVTPRPRVAANQSLSCGSYFARIHGAVSSACPKSLGSKVGATAFIGYLFLYLCIAPARAAVPAIDYLFPPGGQQGATLEMTAGKKADSKAVAKKTDSTIAPWPANVWIDCPGVEFTAADTPGKFNVAIAKNAPLGPHVVRIYNEDGASLPRVFVVGRHSEINEKEPNDDIERRRLSRTCPSS